MGSRQTQDCETEPPKIDAEAESLIQAWDELRQENAQLRAQRAQNIAAGRGPAANAPQRTVVYSNMSNMPQVAVAGPVVGRQVVVAPIQGAGRPMVVSPPGAAPAVTVYKSSGV